MKKTQLLAALLLSTLPLWAGPFGLSLDWTAEDIQASGITVTAVSEKDPSGTALYLVEPESPDPRFSHYAAEVNDNFGLWRIIAVSDRFSSQEALADVFKSLLNDITARYGEPMMDSGTFMKLASPELFPSLALGQTYLAAVLVPDPPTEDFTMLYLSVDSDDGETGFIRLECWSLWLSLLVNGLN